MARSPQTIDDLLADPLIQAVMRADRVETVALKQMLMGVAARRRERALNLTGARVWFCGQPRPASASRLWPPAQSCEDRVNC
jgi:hypothetical protein